MTLTPRSTAISLLVAVVCSSGAFANAAQAERAATQATGQNWQDITVDHAKSLVGAETAVVGGKTVRRGVKARKFRTVSLDKRNMARLVAGAPHERSVKKSDSGFIISLPFPDGGYQRFRLVESPVMEEGLAAKHPDIKTYAGKGVDDPTASLRMDISPLGLHASVRSAKGNWYVDPLNASSDTVHATYFTRDAENTQGALREGAIDAPQLMLDRGIYHAGDIVELHGAGFEPNSSVSITVRNGADSAPIQSFVASANEEGVISITFPADPTGNTGSYEVAARDGLNDTTSSFQVVADSVNVAAAAGIKLRTYRVALLTDPTYATYSGGSAFVTPAKVALMNRVSQIYEDETSIKLVLINDTDKLNLDTPAQITGANGPCGANACFTAGQIASCSSSTLNRNRVVVGLLVGASNYDIGHIALGVDGGGIASLGVVGANAKAQGCTGIPTPVGDFYAVDYVAHEMGHQFAGNHTFNGAIANCASSNRNAGTSVEPGSGSSIMAYAGICGTDDLQTHSDAYWSQRSFDEITTYTSGLESNLNEVQMGVLTGFGSNGQQFQLQYNGNSSAAIVRGTNFTAAGIKAAIEGIAGWPSGATATASAVSDAAFTITFGGTLAGQNVASLKLINCSTGCSGYVGEITAGGATTRNGAVTITNNSAPTVTVSPTFTIPVRTPFALTGSAADVDADTVTYMWEQNDRGAAAGTGLISNTKLNGPLFRQFGTRAVVTAADTITYHSPGENMVTTNPTRVFPDMVQILANNTNAATGACPTASATPTVDQINCFSEYLPTASYVGFAGVNAAPASLHFRLTARDGKGGIGSATTTLVLAQAAGPFRVTSAATAVSYDVGSTQTVTWDVANTNIAPVNTANVKISLSTDGGANFGTVLAASTPNTGSASVVMPSTATTTARLKIEAIDNVFFDVSRSNFMLRAIGDLNSDGMVDCADLAIVKASLNKRTGQAGFDARADLNKDGIVNVLDLTAMTKMLPAGTVCK